MNIIVSDIEGTLTTGSSWRGIRSYFKANDRSWRYNWFFLRWMPRYLLVYLGVLTRRWAINAWMADEVCLLRGFSLDEFNQMAEWIVAHEMWPKRRPDLIAALEDQRQNGTRIAVVSSAYQPIVAAFARRLEAVPIGSSLIFEAGKLAGVGLPVNAYERKAAAIRAHFGEGPYLAAYGDTASDISMLGMSQEPVAVCPDDELRKVAVTRGWKIIEFAE